MAIGEIGQALAVLFPPGSVVEVRAIGEEGTASGYFNDPALLEAAVTPLDAAGTAGVYVTLNEVKPALLSRRANRIKMRLGKKDATTADGDIVRRRWFPIDIDPVRPSGVSASEGEHRAALDRAARIAAFLAERGWPEPVRADSGNGAHLLYRLDLPNDGASHDLVKGALEALDAMFSDGACTVDTANHNAARIWKLYGTTSRKGDHTPDRPHRKARLLGVPEAPGIVGRELLEGLAASLPAPPVQKGTFPRGKALDLRSWLTDHGIGIAAEKPYADGTLFVLDECPFSGDHRDGAFAIQFGSGAIHAGCHHASCGGGSQRWPDLRARYERGKKRGSAGSPPGGGHETTPQGDAEGNFAPGGPGEKPGQGKDRGSPVSRVPGQERGGAARHLPPAAPEDLPGYGEALSLLQHGDPKEAMLRAFACDHEGDAVVAECLVMSLASRSVANTNGLHVSVTGESGKGKSHAFATMLRQVPERFRLEGAMSNKALFYLDGMLPGSVIVLDDQSLSEEVQEILKGATTCFREPIAYRTVTRDRQIRICTIPERCVWWVAKVEGAGDDQVQKRMLTCWIDDSAEQDARVLAHILARDQEAPRPSGEERPGVLVCQALWEVIGQQRLHVMVPFATRIRFHAAANRRNPEMLLDLVKANAVLRFMQRDRQQDGPVPCIVATVSDFREAARLYALLNGTAGGQDTKLTKREAVLLDTIMRQEWPEFTVPMLQKVTGWSNGNIHKILHGYVNRGTTFSGLLEKCPAISYCDRTVVTADEAGGVSMRRRTNAYTFDRDMFRSWSSGGAVWLDDSDGGAGGHDTSPDFPGTSAAAEGIEIEGKGADSENTEYNKNTYICTEDYFPTFPGSQRPVDEGACASLCVCDPGSVEVQKQDREESPSNGERNSQEPPLSLHQDAAPEENTRSVVQSWGSSPPGPAVPGHSPPSPHVAPGPAPPGPSLRIDARDYKPLVPPEKTACHVCGAPWSWYVEKLTEERRHRADRTARRICRDCYARARRSAQEHAMVLPGTFDPSRAERLSAGVGRCTVCDLDPAAYTDRATGTKLCEVCYQRFTREQGREEAMA